VRQVVVAIPIGFCGANNIPVQIRNRHFRRHDASTGGIDDRSADTAVNCLPVRAAHPTAREQEK
jgi:hypothetical protein